MKPIVFALPGNEAMAGRLVGLLDAERGELVVRGFPDGESYVRLVTGCSGAPVLMVATLDRPNDKVLPLLFAADTARDLGATSVGLVAPYLAYMRQDTRFNPGEAITSRTFAALLSSHFDWLVTVDPHLHRFQSMAELYSIPASVVHAAPPMGDWIGANVPHPLVIGPDAESEQWVREVARFARCPYIVMTKERRGDRSVNITVPDVSRWHGLNPVLVDDIISTGTTLVEAARLVRESGMGRPVVVAVHAVFAEGSAAGFKDTGIAPVVTCDTVPHPTNRIDCAALLAEAVIGQLNA